MACVLTNFENQHILVSGQFSKSPFLAKRIQALAAECPSPASVWIQPDCTPHGAVLQAQQLDFINAHTGVSAL